MYYSTQTVTFQPFTFRLLQLLIISIQDEMPVNAVELI